MSEVNSTSTELNELPEEVFLQSFVLFLLAKWKISSGEGKGEAYRFDERPFLYTIATDDFWKKVVIKSAQCGITELEIAEAIFLALSRKGNVLYAFPALQQLRQMVGARVRPAIEDNPYLYAKVSGMLNLEAIQMSGNTLYFTGVQNRRQMISKDVSALFIDELDTAVLEASENHFGNVVYTLEKRLGAASKPIIRYYSTPSYAGMGISAEFAGDDSNLGSDQREWIVKCSYCYKEQEITWEENVIDRNFQLAGDSRYVPDVHRVCTKCRRDLTVEAIVGGRYVAKKPSISHLCHGYHVSKLFTAKPPLNQMWLDSQNPLREQEFRCSDLGSPFEPKGSKLTDEILDMAVANSNHAMLTQSSDQTYMGVDLGKNHNVIIGQETPEKKIKLLYAGEAEDLNAVDALMKRFNVGFGIMDAQPEHLKAKDFCSAHPGRMMAAYYPTYLENTKDIAKDKDDMIIHVNRSLVMSMVIQAFFNGKILLPKDIRSVKDFYKQMKSPVKATQEDTNGNLRTFFPPTKMADHYFHAFVYLMIALEKRPRSVIFIPKGIW
jgi:hypothetical protein